MPARDRESLSDEFFMLWVLIAQCRDAILRARERDYARFGIGNERRAILFIIENSGGRATPVEIARDLFRQIHSVTEMLTRMEADGLITRYKGSGRSKVEVKLTEKGLDVFNQSLHNETDQRIFSALTKGERARLGSYLWKLRGKALEDLGIPEWHLRFPLDPNRPEEK
jgi:DNA-binding MarR family transcriptional regulator